LGGRKGIWPVKNSDTARWTLQQQRWRPVAKSHNAQVISSIPAISAVEKFYQELPAAQHLNNTGQFAIPG